MRLTRGEGHWLERRRGGWTTEEMAEYRGISVDRLRLWERDRAPAPMPDRAAFVAPLTAGEFAALCRRRKGWTLDDVVDHYGTSRMTVWKMEHDVTRTAPRLASWWRWVGIPAPATAAPIQIGEPRETSKSVWRSPEDRGGSRPAKSR